MTGIRVRLSNQKVGPRLRRINQRRSRAALEAARLTAQDTGDRIVQEGRADIASAGNFSSDRWQQGLQAEVTEGGGNILVRVTHAVPYWRVFEFGATIQGKPLLWIPLDFASDAKGVMARDYPGQLFRVDRSGKAPLLLSATDGEPKYFGKEQVTIPKKWDLRGIGARAARAMGRVYRRHFKRLTNG